MKKILITTLLVLIVTPANSQSAFPTYPHTLPKLNNNSADPRGGEWNNTKWGMTESEILSLYPEAIKDTVENSQDYSLVRKTKTTVLDRPFIVYFGFNNNRLVSVRLVYDGNDFDMACIKLESALIDKYGNTPQQASNISGIFSYSYQWFLPLTRINLSCYIYPYKIVNLFYREKQNAPGL